MIFSCCTKSEVSNFIKQCLPKYRFHEFILNWKYNWNTNSIVYTIKQLCHIISTTLMWRHWVMRRYSSSVNCESYWFFCSLHVRSLLCFGRLPLHIEMGSTSGIGWEAIYGEFLHRTGSAKIRCIYLLLSAIVKIGGTLTLWVIRRGK